MTALWWIAGAVWIVGAISGLIATASRYRYEELRDEMKLEAMEGKVANPYMAHEALVMRHSRNDNAANGVAVSLFWPIALPLVAAAIALSILIELAQKPGEYVARKHGLVAIETEVKDCNG